MKTKWTLAEAEQIYHLPFPELVFRAHTVHRENFDPNTVQISTLLNIKTGSCPENCSYCPQSAHYDTGLKKEALMNMNDILESAKRAKALGTTRFCMGAAWREPRDKDLEIVCDVVKEVKKLGLETCVTLGLLKSHQAKMLKDAGLDFYNHNIDTSAEYYDKIITTRTFEDRLKTIEHVRQSDIHVCSGGILGLGESLHDRINMLITLASFDQPPESVTINQLIKIPGTPLENAADVDPFDFIRTIALARMMMPKSFVRLSAGREKMSDEAQALCFLVGANSIHYGEKLLTTKNALPEKDDRLLQRLGLKKRE